MHEDGRAQSRHNAGHSLPPCFPKPVLHTPYYCEENAYHLASSLLCGLEAKQTPGASLSSPQTWPWRSPAIQVYDLQSSSLWTQGQAEPLSHWEVFVVIVTNEAKSVAMWYQTASRVSVEEGWWVRQVQEDSKQSKAWVFDPDSWLCHSSKIAALSTGTESQSQPIGLEDYLSLSFQLPSVPEPASSPSSSCRKGTSDHQHLQPVFKLVPARHFLDNFASDRSHMLRSRPQAPPVRTLGPAETRVSNVGDEAEAPGGQEGMADSIKSEEVVEDMLARSASSEGDYLAPVPPWPPIAGPAALARAETNNLFDIWLRLEPNTEGEKVAEGRDGEVVMNRGNREEGKAARVIRSKVELLQVIFKESKTLT
ncbi:hypothetical protein K437DRAFT_294169 [Tilletiaria anomala UBC 951]|uniref:Protein N-terminal glutamine amidohydrolase n=1 Tax=Tilletiaria anomala (strain ATCC 24038 / CBS 436.72 / UBC 951) TaxID=1037660 RepID=A0A066W880_TILAU|nr:uncharacterized protein K437DRAFT_294169 [Tilletiaria anomala UBC 951]KDN46975.1 hypothetical protein K437DRAFT_294169 [Tilletiaria anomala UBC 951]